MSSASQETAIVLASEYAIEPELASRLRLALMRAARRVRVERSNDAVTISQLAALGTVVSKGPLSAGDLAAIERVQPPSMTKILNSLEDLGLITRSSPASDRRQTIVVSTDAGRALLEDEKRVRDEWLAARLAQFTDDQLAVLRAAIPVLDLLGSE